MDKSNSTRGSKETTTTTSPDNHVPYLPLTPIKRKVASFSPNLTRHNMLRYAHFPHLIAASIA